MTQTRYDSDLVDLIGPIYDTVLDPALWPEVLDRIRRLFHFYNATLGVHALPRGEVVVQTLVGVPPEYVSLLHQYDRYLMDVWGGAAKVARVPLEEPVLQSVVAAGTDYHSNPYYMHWVRPQGINDAVGIGLARDRMTIGSLALGRHESVHPVTEEELEGLRLLVPHIRRAVTISRLLDVAVKAAVTFEAALDASQRAVVIVEEDLVIAFANEAARAMLKAQDPISDVNGRLAVRRELVAGQLGAAVAAAALHEDQLGHRGMALPVMLSDGTPLALHLMPLRHRRVRTDFGRQAVAAIFIAEPGSSLELPADALALIYGLTPAETRVCELVVGGRSTREMAELLGIASSTVRTHLLGVFEKTGRHSRA
jgi:DNA-binding CsgD family transcriptional regulator